MRRSPWQKAAAAMAILLAVALAFKVALAVAQQTSSKYSIDYSEQTWGSARGQSIKFRIVDTIDFAEPEKASQASAKFLVVDSVGVGLQANNGIGAGFGSTMYLSWPHYSSSQMQGYNVHRSGTPTGVYAKLNGAPVIVAQYQDTNLPSGTYYYLITILDLQNIEHEWSRITATIESRAAAPAEHWVLYE